MGFSIGVSCCTWVNLTDVLETQLKVANALGALPERPPRKVKAIVSADATSLWKTSATKCDFFLDVHHENCAIQRNVLHSLCVRRAGSPVIGERGGSSMVVIVPTRCGVLMSVDVCISKW